VALLAVTAGCTQVEVGAAPETVTSEPLVRVGIAVNVAELAVGGGSAMTLASPSGGGLTQVPPGSVATVSIGAGALRTRVGGANLTLGPTVTLSTTDSAGFVRINGRDYRGSVEVAPGANGLLAVNLVTLEAYVAGVVNAEMGRRPPSDSEAVAAQAVVSRTVALRSIGRYRVRGYDLLSTIADQAYGGVTAETAAAWDAVRRTHGEVLTFSGTLIEAFFHSTCGGRTAAVDEVFSGAAQPYLQSISDRDPRGQAYCALSPRFRWREEWTGEALGRTLRDGATLGGYDAADALAPADLQIGSRSPSGRVAELILVAGRRATTLAGEQIVRQVLRSTDGGWLRSAQFGIQVTRAGGRIVKLVADGAGNGHGVGMCQWGAVGRARAGASYRQILSAYFPGTEISRSY
jgi:stage II sporulation protein D (peptidoglycan lytic transglycosylase)